MQALTGLAISAVVTTVLGGLLTPSLSARLAGEALDPGRALQRTPRLLLPLVALALLVAVAEEVGVVALFVGGVWLWGLWAVAAPALA